MVMTELDFVLSQHYSCFCLSHFLLIPAVVCSVEGIIVMGDLKKTVSLHDVYKDGSDVCFFLFFLKQGLMRRLITLLS